MNHREGTFRGIRDARIYYQCWLPDGEPKAALLLVHGLAEHSGRYANLVDHFAPLGYALYGLDHLGHGKSDGTRVYVNRFSDYVDTLKIYVDMVRDWEPGRPVFLVGHSMGGLIGALFLLDHQEDLAGAVLSGPAVKVPDNISGGTIVAGKILSALLPKVGLIALEAKGICRDPGVVAAYVNDPLVHTGKTTARLGAELIKSMQRITHEAGAITLPLLIIQGGADRLVDPGGAAMLFETVGSTDKEIKIYDDFYHEVFNEPEHERVLEDVEAWLEKRLRH
jgi:alpha-beta hydrolase superfamily lysophospholipase